MNDSVLIVGTGAMACLFASYLTAGGVQVTLLGTWKEGLRALQTHGVCLVREDGSEQDHPVRATCDPADCAGARWALVMVKSWQTRRAAQQLLACLAPDGVALTLQNGLGNRETLVEAFGEQRIALGVTTTGATLLAPGCVRMGGEGVISLGAHSRLNTWADLLQT